MQVEHILPLKQDGSERMKRKVDEPLKVLESGRDERRKDHRYQEILSDCKTYFRSKIQFFCSKN